MSMRIMSGIRRPIELRRTRRRHFPEQAAESLSRWAYVEAAPPDLGQRRRLYLMITDAALGAVRLRVP
jgi:hypothetical protein